MGGDDGAVTKVDIPSGPLQSFQLCDMEYSPYLIKSNPITDGGDGVFMTQIVFHDSGGPGFVNPDQDQKLSPFGSGNKIGTGNSISRVLLLGPGTDFNQSR